MKRADFAQAFDQSEILRKLWLLDFRVAASPIVGEQGGGAFTCHCSGQQPRRRSSQQRSSRRSMPQELSSPRGVCNRVRLHSQRETPRLRGEVLGIMPFGNSTIKKRLAVRLNPQQFCKPKGIVNSCPGLRGTSYTGSGAESIPTPTGLCPFSTAEPQPRWGCRSWLTLPKVARSSQPWALGRNPFGIRRDRTVV